MASQAMTTGGSLPQIKNRKLASDSCVRVVPHRGIVSSPPASRWSIKADFIGMIVMALVFDNSPDKWIRWIRKKASPARFEYELKLALWLKSQAKKDPTFLKRVKAMADGFSATKDFQQWMEDLKKKRLAKGIEIK